MSNTLLNHQGIEEHHAATLERMYMQHRSTLDMQTARDLYLCAKAAALQQTRPVELPITIVESAREESGVYVGVATDMTTGLFIQLAANPTHPSSTLITFGQKWGIEARDGTGQLQIKYF